MKSRGLMLVVMALAGFQMKAACTLRGSVDLYLNGWTLTSDGNAYVDRTGAILPCQEITSGTHQITSSEFQIVGTKTFTDTNGNFYNYEWNSTLTASAKIGTCYRAYLQVWAANDSQGWGTSQVCTASPPSADWCQLHPLSDECGDPFQCPLLVNMQPGAWVLTSPSEGVAFDMNADGRSDRISWTAAGVPLAFVALDLNGNGRIDNGSELFSEFMTDGNGGRIANGFVALQRYDVNGDAVVDARDPIWLQLLLWTDTNHNGTSEPGELQRVTQTTLASLSTRYQAIGRLDGHGNLFRYQSQATFRTGRRDQYYDVYFQLLP